MTQAVIRNGAYYATFSAMSVRDIAAEQGVVAAIGSNWEDWAKENLSGLELVPEEPRLSHAHNRPVLIDGVIRWELPE